MDENWGYPLLVRSNPGEWLDPTQKKHVALYWKPSFDVLL